MNGAYAYGWEYKVKESSIRRFETIYGPNGQWVRLFDQAEGYLGTDLMRDTENPGRYITIDHWASKAAYDQFRDVFAGEYEKVDSMGDELTESEHFLGHFQSVTWPRRGGGQGRPE